MNRQNAVPKNWFYSPSVYNSRASSVIPSSHAVRRPTGIYYNQEGDPKYGPSRELDFELEMGYFVAENVQYGSTLDIANSADHIFGFVLLNDWSARDFQKFEMTPLGPFHSKGFATSISPWVVTMEALEQFACQPKTIQDPPPFKHLTWFDKNGTFDVSLNVTLIRTTALRFFW